MELWIKVTKMATSINYLFEVGFDISEVGLVKQCAMAAASCSAFRALEILAFSFEFFLRVKSTLFKDDLHSFKPTWHTQMALVIIEGLNSPIGQYRVSHSDPT